MNKRTKLILSIIGASAIIIPVVLLVVLTKNPGQDLQLSSDKRSIDTKTIEESVKNVPKPQQISPMPSPATPSASPASEGSPSVR